MMSSNDRDDDEQQPESQRSSKTVRDARGRWLPGHCPNPKGRPKKEINKSYDPRDIRFFGNTVIDFNANGQKLSMDRREALLNKMFESAMKGKVTMQRFLYQEFEKNDKRIAAASARYQRLLFDWIIDHPKYGKSGYDRPLEIEIEMEALRNVLEDYYPGRYSFNRETANDKSVEDDDENEDEDR